MALRPQREMLQVFSLSFLDIISCAFGAIVMLVLLAKNADQQPGPDIANMADLLRTISQEEDKISLLNQQLASRQQALSAVKSEAKSAAAHRSSLNDQLALAKQKGLRLDANSAGLSLVLESKKLAATRLNSTQKRDDAVGGIPVDSEYVIFIVDTSGSMRRIWPRLIAEMDKILDIHPQVKGFQVMNDMGTYLISANAGGWIRDSPRVRRSVLEAMKSWYSNSNSSPVEGLEVALKTYAKPGVSLALYILGDEYHGGSYDPVFRSLNRLNTDKKTGKRIARVHGIGFVSGVATDRFSTLMREVAKQNRGTFLALPR
jgi:hypothetical protein